MKTFRFAALGAALVLCGADVASAQPPAGPRQDHALGAHARRARDGGPRAGVAGRALLRGVELTQTQRTQIAAINQKFAGERRALTKEGRGAAGALDRREQSDSATRAQLRSRVQSLVERHRTEIRAILTPEQQRTFDANVAQLRTRGEARRGKAHTRR